MLRLWFSYPNTGSRHFHVTSHGSSEIDSMIRHTCLFARCLRWSRLFGQFGGEIQLLPIVVQVSTVTVME